MKALYAQDDSSSESLAEQQLQEQPSEETYAMVALIPPADVAEQLAMEGGESQELLHVTLCYLGLNATQELDRAKIETVVASVAADWSPISGIFNGSCVFGPTDDDNPIAGAAKYPLVTTLDAPGLEMLRVELDKAIRSVADYPEDTHGFVPHCTMAYPDAMPASMPEPPMIEVVFPDVCVCWGDYVSDPANLTRITLGPQESPRQANTASAETIHTLSVPGGTITWNPSAATATSTASTFHVKPTGAVLSGSVANEAIHNALDELDPIATTEVPTREPEWEALLIVEGKPTDDGRVFADLTWRPPPFAAEWTDEEGYAHDGAERFGTVTEVERRENGEIWARGVYIDSETAAEVRRLVDQGEDVMAAGWPSVQIGGPDKAEQGSEDGEIVPAEEIEVLPDGSIMLHMTGKIVGFALVPIQAQEGTVFRNLQPALPVAAAIPVNPPDEWFEPPNLSGPTPLTITDEGQVFGHFALWDGSDACYRGKSGCLRAPRAKDKTYSSFRVGYVVADSGERIPTGSLVLTGGHRSLQAIAAGHADTRTGVADVVVGEDRWGPWVAGALRPTTTPEEIRVMRGSALSGEWYGNELLGITCVNRPAFLVRALAASTGDIKALQIVGPSPEDDDMDQETFNRLHAAAHEPEPAAEEEPDETLDVNEAAVLPIAALDAPWDEAGAKERVVQECNGEPSCLALAFLYRENDADPKDPEGYSLGYVDVIDGQMTTIPQGVFSAAEQVQGDPTVVPPDQLDSVKEQLTKLYQAISDMAGDPSIVPPWEAEQAVAAAAAIDDRMLGSLDRRVLSSLDRRVG